MTLVIGLHGAKGSGKDQFYKAVKAAFPQLDVRKIAYADPIKNEVLNIFGLDTEEHYDEFKRTDLTFTVDKGYTWRQTAGRQAVREIGMLMRRYDEHQFVRYVEDQIKAAPQALWLITDVRFENEHQSIVNNLGGLIIKIKRGGFTFDGHATEQEFADELCTSVIYNYAMSLEEYNDRVVREMNTILQTIANVKESK